MNKWDVAAIGFGLAALFYGCNARADCDIPAQRMAQHDKDVAMSLLSEQRDSAESAVLWQLYNTAENRYKAASSGCAEDADPFDTAGTSGDTADWMILQQTVSDLTDLANSVVNP